MPKKVTSSEKKSSAPKAAKGGASKKNASAPKAATKTATKAATKTATKAATKTATKEDTSVQTPAPTPAVVQESTAKVVKTKPDLKESLAALDERFSTLATSLATFKELHTQITKDLKSLQKDVTRTIRENSKKTRQKRVLTEEEKANRTPSGFAKPGLISDELCTFLGKPTGTEIARTEVTKFLTSYIKQHQLQDPNEKRRIHPDDKLRKLLNVTDEDKVTYFNIQKYMKVHFIKSSSAAQSS